MATNVERLVSAGIITKQALTPAGEKAINAATISDAEIQQLQGVQKKLGLGALDLSQPGGPGLWQL